MVDALRSSVWLYRLAFLGLAALFLFLKLLPLGSLAGDWPGPDILLCLIFAWVVRRPDFLPVPLIAAVLLLDDLLLMRPPGLWTALVILATEFIRSRAALTRELGFVTEWLLVAGMMVALLISYRLAFAFAFLPQPGFGFALMQTLWSILCYPLVVAASRLAFDLRKPATGEVDAYGRRL
ncbi:rod shape-determining protein MreD [Tabrizicola sp. TH137]|uniref:rod shape-determining protein MreD n=1 Tax=Tabrizicola sp. TH137 TaxID=2067452 RepID=UPI000C7A641F|nr:rod shape-determining protein MreD [Tabrizicola sp. TH137]PLL12657.1 rod shape-determining protein MreD [Tabrizicola sp. TH137]